MEPQFTEFKDFIAFYSFSLQDKSLPSRLKLFDDGLVSIFYAPFDFVNMSARIVILGITPGLQQALLALIEARKQILAGAPDEIALQSAKKAASFGGPMRNNLIRMLDFIQLPEVFGIRSSQELFAQSSGLVHFTSVLRNPVLIRGSNYNGLPNMLAHKQLIEQIETRLAAEIQSLPDSAVFIPLGPKPAAALHHLEKRNLIHPDCIWEGLPHPSGANAERIAFFLGLKKAEHLSPNTNAAALRDARDNLLSKVNKCRGRTH